MLSLGQRGNKADRRFELALRQHLLREFGHHRVGAQLVAADALDRVEERDREPGEKSPLICAAPL
jgi:hypothetical protein